MNPDSILRRADLQICRVFTLGTTAKPSNAEIVFISQQQCFWLFVVALIVSLTTQWINGLATFAGGILIMLPMFFTARRYFRCFGAKQAKTMLGVLCLGEVAKWLSVLILFPVLLTLVPDPRVAVVGLGVSLAACWAPVWYRNRGWFHFDE